MKNLILNYNLSKNSWFGSGGNADKFFIPDDEDDLIKYLKNFKNEKFIPIGSGSNILFRDNGCTETIIKLGKNFRKIDILNNKIYCGAATLKNQVSQFALKNSFSNLEFLSCIPGTMGGGVIMNAGCFGFEFKNILHEIHIIDEFGNKKRIKSNDIIFGYRRTNLPKNIILTKLVLNPNQGYKKDIIKKINLFKRTKESKQPSKIKTGGSTFKNPVYGLKAWELIKKSGCDKIKFGKVKFSDLHCNFIENKGSSGKDIEDLINYTIDEVNKKFNVILEPEIKIIGEK